MANIFAILPGLSYEAMCAMRPAHLMTWHDRAIARSGNSE